MKKKKPDPNAIPKYSYDRITDITVEDLRNMGAEGVGIDIDNTTAYDSTMKVFTGVIEWIRNVRDSGLAVIIISNTYTWRARKMSKLLGGIPWIGTAKKPHRRNFYRAARILDIDISKLVMIGDQLFTDIQGANAAGAISVRVKPARDEVLFGIRYKLLRRRENRYLRKNRIEPGDEH